MEIRQVAERNKGIFSFGSMLLIVGALGLAGLLFWGWKTGQDLPLWPALAVVAVNLLGAFKLLQATRARQAAARERADAARQGQAAAEPAQARSKPR